jgi:hypothetical protein
MPTLQGRLRALSLSAPGHRERPAAKIERYGLTRTIYPDHFFPTLDAAVAEFVRETGATWGRPAAGSRPSQRSPKSSQDEGAGWPQ